MPGQKRKRSKSATRQQRVAIKRYTGTRPRGNSKPLRTRHLTENTVYSYSRYAIGDVSTELSQLSAGFALDFALNKVKGYTEFTPLYDNFMITGVKIMIQLVTNPDSTWTLNTVPASSTAQPTNWFPKIWYIMDNDDAVAPDLDAMRERQGVKVKVLRPNSQISFFVKPSFQTQTYRTALSTGYAPKRGFLDVATGQNVPHYGFKYALDANGIDPNDSYPFKVNMTFKYYLKFKGVL